ncbi:MAG: NAD(P)H-dependent oxidoreductase subunit E [Candidatus Omnitrophica bacterium]|nr:NAD(P)H-dependent oxidoreductase subunit E [Candidatus Omnitrophota bacterium]
MEPLTLNSQTQALFSAALQAKLDAKVAKYETRRASILEVLHLIMEEKGHIALEDEKNVAQYLSIPPIDVREVMTFYTLYYDKPKAKTRFNVCRTLACHLTGGDELLKYLEEKLGIHEGQMSKDGKCSLKTVECLGACEIAPMMQINDHEYAGNLTKEKIDELLKRVKCEA